MNILRKNRRSVPLYLQILLGMLIGVLAGILALYLNGNTFVNDWIKPWGQVFIRLLQLIAVPLVFVSLIKGVMGLKDISRFSRIGIQTILIYIGTTCVAIVLGLILVLSIRPGNYFDSSNTESMQQSYAAVVEEKKQEAASNTQQGPLAFLNEIVPENIIGAAGNNQRMLQVIFFAILFGIAAISIPSSKSEPVAHFIESLYDILLRMIDYIIRFAPVGVFALMAGLVIDYSGDLSMFSALGIYAGTVIMGLLLLTFAFYPMLVHFFTRLKVKPFLRNIRPVQLLAFSTSSSAATLPLTIETAEREMKISSDVATFVLPVGSTVNMDGTSCYQAVAVVFIAQVLGIELGWSELISILLLTVLSSIGTPSIPGGSYVILTMVLSTVGIPPEGLALILGIDRPLDMLRTVTNVTGDVTVSAIVDKNSG